MIQPHDIDEMNDRTCTFCKGTKPTIDFYKKGESRLDSRCKSCVKLKKSERYRGGQKLLDTRDIERHSQKYREEQGLPRFEAHGECPVIIDAIYIPVANTQVSTGRILELYHKDLPIEEIAKIVSRKPKHIMGILRKVGIGEVRRQRRPFQRPEKEQLPVPYGWQLSRGRLVRHRGEQWILERIESELKAKVDPDSIASALNAARVKPRHVRSWIPQMIEHVAKENRKLMLSIPNSRS